MDGHEGVQLFESDGHFEYVPSLFCLKFLIIYPSLSVILLDMSMPILDGRQSRTLFLADFSKTSNRIRCHRANKEDRGIKIGTEIFLHPRSYRNVHTGG